MTVAPSMNKREPILACDRVSRWFGGVHALKGVSISIAGGEIFGLVGPNGCGKTTVVNADHRLLPAAAGHIVLNGADITGLTPHRIARLGVARTFQNLALFKGMSVLDNILLGRHVHMRPERAAHAVLSGCGRARQEIAHRAAGRGHHRLPAAAGRTRRAGRGGPAGAAEAGGAGARAGGRAAAS